MGVIGEDGAGCEHRLIGAQGEVEDAFLALAKWDVLESRRAAGEPDLVPVDDLEVGTFAARIHPALEQGTAICKASTTSETLGKTWSARVRPTCARPMATTASSD